MMFRYTWKYWYKQTRPLDHSLFDYYSLLPFSAFRRSWAMNPESLFCVSPDKFVTFLQSQGLESRVRRSWGVRQEGQGLVHLWRSGGHTLDSQFSLQLLWSNESSCDSGSCYPLVPSRNMKAEVFPSCLIPQQLLFLQGYHLVWGQFLPPVHSLLEKQKEEICMGFKGRLS